jgi:putative heme-binding domain-containing protein
VAALSVLEVLGAVPAEVLAAALDDEHPRMRSAAAQILANRGVAGERLSAAAPLYGALVRRTRDPEERVRLDALLALGMQAAGPERDAALERAGREETNRWVVLAAAAGLSSTNAAWLSKVHPAPRWQRPPPRPVQADPDRERVVQTLRPALDRTGDRARGAALCARLCLSCHYLQGQGQRVGPDLAGLGGRPPETLLVDLLDPSRQVAPDYQPYEFVLTDDSRLTGLLASESETRVTVRQPGSPDLSLARSQIREIRPTGRSLMPDGLESGLTVADLADLLAFLRTPDAALLPR